MWRPHPWCAVLLVAACAAKPADDMVAREVAARTDHLLANTREPEDRPTIPDGVRLDDGLSEDEAVALALWNNPRLRADLTRLASAEGDLADARRPSNPTLRFLFPSGPQQLSVLLTWPLESLVFMRRRVAVARANLDVVAQNAVQIALDLSREARVAHVQWQLELDRLEVRRSLASHADEIAVIAEARGAAGDVALREPDAARANARVAADEATRAEADVAVAAARLRAVMNLPASPSVLRPEPSELPSPDALGSAALGSADLEAVALDSRPDLRAAALAITWTEARIKAERVGAVRFSGVASGQGTTFTGGPQVELPIFNQNQGGIQRARADNESARWRYQELRLQIISEVEQAQVLHARAARSLEEYRDVIVVARERDIDVDTATYDAGETDYSGVLLAAQQLEQARLREVELMADLRRGRADIERAIGRRMASIPAKEAQ